MSVEEKFSEKRAGLKTPTSSVNSNCIVVCQTFGKSFRIGKNNNIYINAIRFASTDLHAGTADLPYDVGPARVFLGDVWFRPCIAGQRQTRGFARVRLLIFRNSKKFLKVSLLFCADLFDFKMGNCAKSRSTGSTAIL